MRFRILVIVLAGLLLQCTSKKDHPDPYARKPIYPGVLFGTWIVINDFQAHGPMDTNRCTATIIEADSLLNLTILNNTTNEVLTIKGHAVPSRHAGPDHSFKVSLDSSNFYGLIDKPERLFARDNLLDYITSRGKDAIFIRCEK